MEFHFLSLPKKKDKKLIEFLSGLLSTPKCFFFWLEGKNQGFAPKGLDDSQFPWWYRSSNTPFHASSFFSVNCYSSKTTHIKQRLAKLGHSLHITRYERDIFINFFLKVNLYKSSKLEEVSFWHFPTLCDISFLFLKEEPNDAPTLQGFVN